MKQQKINKFPNWARPSVCNHLVSESDKRFFTLESKNKKETVIESEHNCKIVNMMLLFNKITLLQKLQILMVDVKEPSPINCPKPIHEDHFFIENLNYID
jgi:hypothetical protein